MPPQRYAGSFAASARAGRVGATVSQWIVQRTVVTPRFCTKSSLWSRVPGPSRSHASSWMPYWIPGAALAGPAAQKDAAARAEAQSKAKRGISAEATQPARSKT